MLALWLMSAFLVKHFICDYPLQLKYMLEEKGTYFEEGGIHHAIIHGCGTVIVLGLFGLEEIAPQAFVLDTMIHYHIDYLKMKVNRWMCWSAKDKSFWNAVGLDQLAHQATYVLIVALALAK